MYACRLLFRCRCIIVYTFCDGRFAVATQQPFGFLQVYGVLEAMFYLQFLTDRSASGRIGRLRVTCLRTGCAWLRAVRLLSFAIPANEHAKVSCILQGPESEMFDTLEFAR